MVDNIIKYHKKILNYIMVLTVIITYKSCSLAFIL